VTDLDMTGSMARQVERFDELISLMFLTHVTCYREVPWILMVASPHDATKIATIDREFLKERSVTDQYPDHAGRWAELTNRLDPARAVVTFLQYEFGDEGPCCSVTVSARDDATNALFEEKRDDVRRYLAARASGNPGSA
jgi:hypothetical protein